jgi:hypothetical protein
LIDGIYNKEECSIEKAHRKPHHTNTAKEFGNLEKKACATQFPLEAHAISHLRDTVSPPPTQVSVVETVVSSGEGLEKVNVQPVIIDETDVESGKSNFVDTLDSDESLTDSRRRY